MFEVSANNAPGKKAGKKNNKKEKDASGDKTNSDPTGPLLYNLATDPAESKNVAAEHPELVTQLLEEAVRREIEIRIHRRPVGQLGETE